jgi:hypothetical protein
MTGIGDEQGSEPRYRIGIPRILKVTSHSWRIGNGAGQFETRNFCTEEHKESNNNNNAINHTVVF